MSALPRRPRGRPTAGAEARYQIELEAFCARLLEIRSGLDFEIGSRGWGYILEGERVIDKGELDEAERLITFCRKSGALPLDFCAEDEKRAANGVESLDDPDVEKRAKAVVDYIGAAHKHYTPLSFWEKRKKYIEIAVEKSDLRSLFGQVAREFHVVIQSIGGWADLNVRAGMMRRFAEWERRGKQCVLIYCGDHDPGGLLISDFLRSNLEELAGAVGWSPDHLIIDRFGLDYEFIEGNGLVWIDNLETGSGRSLADSAHPDHKKPYVQDYLRQFGARKVEANALVARPEAGRQLCRDAILKYIPADTPALYQRRLAARREELRQAIARQVAEGRAS
jgi:hypothetical protein